MLGDFHQRKMYDRGLLGVSPAATPEEAKKYSSKFYESRQKRGYAPTSSGSTPIYNFDEWSRTHYQSAKQRRDDAKIRYEELLRARGAEKDHRKSQSIISVLLLSSLMFLFYQGGLLDYDTPKKNLKKNDDSNTRIR